MKITRKIKVTICDFCNKQENDDVILHKCLKCGADFCSNCGEIFTSENGNYDDKFPQVAEFGLCKHCIADIFKIPEDKLD